jgi:uncharacterized membrane protein YbhN (UPF0104 family)
LKPQTKSAVKLLVKLLLTTLALWIVARNIALPQLGELLLSINYLWLGAALIFFILSKIVSAIRLLEFFKLAGLEISLKYNLRLYWVGMFHNLYLPGGIGGDGYKIYLLKKYFDAPYKKLIGATLIDRISGMVALCFLLLLLMLGSTIIDRLAPFSWLVWLFLLLVYPLSYLKFIWFFKSFRNAFLRTSWLSLGVQSIQLISTFFLLKSLHVGNMIFEYQALFLFSSIIAVLPFTIGGVGAREIVVLLFYEQLGLEEHTAIAFSLLFFIMTAFVSILGAIPGTEPEVKSN